MTSAEFEPEPLGDKTWTFSCQQGQGRGAEAVGESPGSSLKARGTQIPKSTSLGLHGMVKIGKDLQDNPVLVTCKQFRNGVFKVIK